MTPFLSPLKQKRHQQKMGGGLQVSQSEVATLVTVCRWHADEHEAALSTFPSGGELQRGGG